MHPEILIILARHGRGHETWGRLMRGDPLAWAVVSVFLFSAIGWYIYKGMYRRG